MAYHEVNDMHQIISEHIQHFWAIFDHYECTDAYETTKWKPFITAVLDACAISRGGTCMPCSATEFVLVKGIIDLLASLGEAHGKDTEELRKMLRILGEHEEAAGERTIEQAYEAASLHRLFPEYGVSLLFQ
jgi:hypothetical protein